MLSQEAGLRNGPRFHLWARVGERRALENCSQRVQAAMWSKSYEGSMADTTGTTEFGEIKIRRSLSASRIASMFPGIP